MEEKKCRCGSVQFSYAGKCLACGLTKKERDLLIEMKDFLADNPIE